MVILLTVSFLLTVSSWGVIQVIVLRHYNKVVANPCDARESYQFFPNVVTLAIGIQHQFSRKQSKTHNSPMYLKRPFTTD